jgi:hypothetical protein
VSDKVDQAYELLVALTHDEVRELGQRLRDDPPEAWTRQPVPTTPPTRQGGATAEPE